MNENLTFEESLKQLEGIIRELEKGQSTLDNSLLHYKNGIGHLTHCHQLLTQAEKKLEVMLKDSDGNIAPKEIESLKELKNLK